MGPLEKPQPQRQEREEMCGFTMKNHQQTCGFHGIAEEIADL